MLNAIKMLFELSVVPELGVKVHQEFNSGFVELVRSIGMKVRNTPVEFVAFRPTGLMQDHYLVIVHTKQGAAVIQHNDYLIKAQDAPVPVGRDRGQKSAVETIAFMVERHLAILLRELEDKLRHRAVTAMIESNAIRPTEQSLTDIIAQSWNDELTGKA